MPTCFVTISQDCRALTDADREAIRATVAKELDSKSRRLDSSHVVLREQVGRRSDMLGAVELEVFCQFFLRRFFDRDKRANRISTQVGQLLHGNCATWINMGIVGYSRVTLEGKSYFSD